MAAQLLAHLNTPWTIHPLLLQHFTPLAAELLHHFTPSQQITPISYTILPPRQLNSYLHLPSLKKLTSPLSLLHQFTPLDCSTQLLPHFTPSEQNTPSLLHLYTPSQQNNPQPLTPFYSP